MSDIVDRLRKKSRLGHWPLLGDEAADEIEQLRADLATSMKTAAKGIAALSEVVNERAASPVVAHAALGAYLFKFDSFAGWVNHAQRAWKSAGVRSDDTVCIDTAGRICRIGRDFMAARDQGTFPVRVYMMRDDLHAPAAAAPHPAHEGR